MLHLETVEPDTLSLLKRLMEVPELRHFNLVGGTALSLKYGHRKSIDLDLFSDKEFDPSELTQLLLKEFGEEFIYEHQNVKWAIFCKIQNVKVDIIRYKEKKISEIEVKDGIRIFGDADLAAMKVNAILGRGVKKDFWDIAEILKNYSISQILEWHKEKYPNQMLLISIPNALTYFADADESVEPETLNNQSWEDVKKFIQLKVREFLQ